MRNPSSITQAMLMAAGLGTRLHPFTQFRTKALMPVLGIPVAQYALDGLLEAGVTQLVANVHHLAEDSSKRLLGLDYGSARLSLSDESEQLLGSGGGIKTASDQLSEGAFFLANADVVCDIDWRALAHCHLLNRKKHGVTVTLTVFPAGPPGAAYREILSSPSSSLITGLGEHKISRPYFVGAAVLEKEALKHLPSGIPFEFVPSILQPAIEAGRAAVFHSTGTWYDIGEPSLWLKAHLAMMNPTLTKSDSSSLSVSRWLKRINEVNEEVSSGIWIAKGSPAVPSLEDWQSPCYWDGRGVQNSFFPKKLGPRSILYGEAVSSEKLQNGIGFSGMWEKEV